nr:hypothetical protein Iba_chr09bCG11430 [Ipomoea batatas]
MGSAACNKKIGGSRWGPPSTVPRPYDGRNGLLEPRTSALDRLLALYNTLSQSLSLKIVSSAADTPVKDITSLVARAVDWDCHAKSRYTKEPEYNGVSFVTGMPTVGSTGLKDVIRICRLEQKNSGTVPLVSVEDPPSNGFGEAWSCLWRSFVVSLLGALVAVDVSIPAVSSLEARNETTEGILSAIGVCTPADAFCFPVLSELLTETQPDLPDGRYCLPR